MLKDIDIDKVPEDKDIILERKVKEMIAVGRIGGGGGVKDSVYFEKSFEEIRQEYFWSFENEIV